MSGPRLTRRALLAFCAAALRLGVAPLAAQDTIRVPVLYAWPAPPSTDSTAAPRDTAGLRFRLVEGTRGGAPLDAAGVAVEGARLTPAQTAALLARLPALTRADAATVDTFAFAGSRMPPPRDRFTVAATFPHAARAPDRRHAPTSSRSRWRAVLRKMRWTWARASPSSSTSRWCRSPRSAKWMRRRFPRA